MRDAERAIQAWPIQAPPRRTRDSPSSDPIGSTAGSLPYSPYQSRHHSKDCRASETVPVHWGGGLSPALSFFGIPFFSTTIRLTSIIIHLVRAMVCPKEKGVYSPVSISLGFLQAYSHWASVGSSRFKPGQSELIRSKKACSSPRTPNQLEDPSP